MKKKIELILKSIIYRTGILSLPFYIFRLFPINKNKIICSNFYGKGYGDSQRYIIDELLKRNNKKYDIVWVIQNENITGFPKEVRTVKINSLKYIYELVTAKVWIFNTRKNIIVKKRKNQFYIQTWHGGIALKKIEKDAIDKLDKNYINQAKEDSKDIDLLVSNGKFCTDMYKRAFWYDKEIIECGLPRNDILVNGDRQKIKKIVKDFFGIKDNENIILYAPTFRNEYINNPYDIDFNNVIKVLKQITNEDWKVLIRLHPGQKNPEKYVKFSENIINAFKYKDIQELILSSNILITDYSSTMFEAMIANIIVVLYANDIDNYRNERGMYFEFEELPFKLTRNNKELLEVLSNIDFSKIQNNYKNFKDRIGLIENGNASGKICDIIEKL